MNFTFRQHGSLLPVRRIVLAGLLVFGTLLSFAAYPAIPLDDWRNEVAALRVKAENDSPQAYLEAQLLQKDIPAGAMLADHARMLNLLSRIELHLALIPESVRHSAEAKVIARQANDAAGQVEADLNIALGAINQGRLDDMIAATQDGMSLLETIQRDDLRAEMMFQAAMMYLRFGQFEETLTVAMQALEVANNVDDQRVRAYAEQSMGVAYIQSGRHADARRHYLNMLEAGRQAHHTLLEAAALLGLSSAAGGMGDSKEAERLIGQAIELFRRVGAPFYVSHAQHQLANIHVGNKQLEKALPLLDANAKIYEEHDNPIGLWWTLQSRSYALQVSGKLDKARKDAERAYALAQTTGFNIYMSGSAQRLAEVAAAQGSHKEAYRWSAEAAALKEKSDREKSGKRVLDLAKRFQEESKQRKIDELKRHNELQHARQRQMQIGLAAVFILLGVTVYFLLRLRKSREEIRALNVGLEQRVLERTVELLESRQSLAEAQRIAKVGSWENNLVDNVLTWSEEVYRIFEIDSQQFGASYEAFMEAVHPDDRGVLDSAFNASLENREPFEIEHRLLLPDGRIKYVHEHCETSYDADGRPLRSIGTVQDITERKEMENALRESRQMLTEAQRIAQVGSWELDHVSNVLSWSDESYRIFEIGSDQFGGSYKAFLDTVHPGDRDTVHRIFQASLENRAPYEIEHRLSFPDGRIKYVHEHCETSYSADGRPLRSIGTVQDITERKEMENALLESRQLLTEAQRIAQVGSWEYDIASDTHTWSEELFRIYEIDPVKEGASYEGCFNATHPDDRDAITRAYLNSVETGQPYESEHRLLMADGRIKHVHERCETIRGADGTLLRAVGMMQDITERKRIEEALAAREREFRSLAENSPDNIVRWDTAGRYLYINPTHERTLGMPLSEVAGTTIPDSHEKVKAAIAQVVATGLSVQIEQRVEVNGNTEVHVISLAPEFDEGGRVASVLGIGRDITDLKRYEAAREAALVEAQRLADLRSEFIAHMSHELRTPLNGILGYAQMLGRDSKLDEKQQASMDVIRQSGEHLLALIDDILDLARIESGRLELDMSDIPLARFLNVVAGIVGLRARQKQLEFVCEFAPDLPEGIRGDEKRLRQVLLNLLSNAVKFTDRGKVTLSVSRVTPLRLAFAVKDTGIGIDSSERETIFQSFEQVSDARHRQGGTGLGLSISRQLVCLMGGDIVVESRPGEGSTFRFELNLPEIEIKPQLLVVLPEDTQQVAPEYAVELVQPLVAPPQDEIRELHRLALLGNMRDIANYAEHMASQAPRYRPFAEHLKRLAKSYQSKAILAFVEVHLLQQDTLGGETDAKQDSTIDPDKGDVI